MSDAQREAGRIPRTIECELVHDLVDSCVPGDTVTVTGIVKVSNAEEGTGWFFLHFNSLSEMICQYSSFLFIVLNLKQFNKFLVAYKDETFPLK